MWFWDRRLQQHFPTHNMCMGSCICEHVKTKRHGTAASLSSWLSVALPSVLLLFSSCMCLFNFPTSSVLLPAIHCLPHSTLLYLPSLSLPYWSAIPPKGHACPGAGGLDLPHLLPPSPACPAPFSCCLHTSFPSLPPSPYPQPSPCHAHPHFSYPHHAPSPYRRFMPSTRFYRTDGFGDVCWQLCILRGLGRMVAGWHGSILAAWRTGQDTAFSSGMRWEGPTLPLLTNKPLPWSPCCYCHDTCLCWLYRAVHYRYSYQPFVLFPIRAQCAQHFFYLYFLPTFPLPFLFSGCRYTLHVLGQGLTCHAFIMFRLIVFWRHGFVGMCL